MGHSHGGAAADRSPKRGRRLLIALALNLGVTIAELVGGIISGSLALLADAAHNFSDAGSILVSYIAWRISQREADRSRTFGYARSETVGALINLTTLFVIGLYLLYEAVTRFFNPGEVIGTTMIIVGVIALVEDLFAAWVLRKEMQSLNVRSTFMHMIADALATVGVLLAGGAILLWGPAANWVDPAVTALIAVYIFVHASKEIREGIGVLMDSAPEGFDYDKLLKTIRSEPAVSDVHHLHVWQPEEGKLALEAHLVVSENDMGKATELKERVKSAVHDRCGIAHATIELELAGVCDHQGELIWKE